MSHTFVERTPSRVISLARAEYIANNTFIEIPGAAIDDSSRFVKVSNITAVACKEAVVSIYIVGDEIPFKIDFDSDHEAASIFVKSVMSTIMEISGSKIVKVCR